MRIDNHNETYARVGMAVTIFLGLTVVAGIAMTSAAPWWVRYPALGLATAVALGGLWSLRRLVIAADFDDDGITLFTLRGRIELPWTKVEKAIITLRATGSLQQVVMTLTTADRRRYTLSIRENHWRRLGEIDELARKVEVRE